MHDESDQGQTLIVSLSLFVRPSLNPCWFHSICINNMQMKATSPSTPTISFAHQHETEPKALSCWNITVLRLSLSMSLRRRLTNNQQTKGAVESTKVSVNEVLSMIGLGRFFLALLSEIPLLARYFSPSLVFSTWNTRSSSIYAFFASSLFFLL